MPKILDEQKKKKKLLEMLAKQREREARYGFRSRSGRSSTPLSRMTGAYGSGGRGGAGGAAALMSALFAGALGGPAGGGYASPWMAGGSADPIASAISSYYSSPYTTSYADSMRDWAGSVTNAPARPNQVSLSAIANRWIPEGAGPYLTSRVPRVRLWGSYSPEGLGLPIGG